MTQKVCFVAMGFGKKMDYQNSTDVNLDRIYNHVIKPLFQTEFPNYKLIRADEIAGSAVIDVSMYALLLNADLVIADLTTLNANAIYELGVRHAVRPYATIIMVQEDNKLPFDLDHSRYLSYKKIEEDHNQYSLAEIKDGLKEFILASDQKTVDSPLYTYLPNTQPPTISAAEYHKLIKDAEENTETITHWLEQAEASMSCDDFSGAIPSWKKLVAALPNNPYVVQQLALATYKSERPTKTFALEKALEIIKKLKPDDSLDLETLGITGAIYKNLFRLNHNYDYLDKALEYYEKGFIIKKDYYNGENYANCLVLKSQQGGLATESIGYLNYKSSEVYQKVISLIETRIAEGEQNYWMDASLSAAYLFLGDQAKHLSYQEKFYQGTQVQWERQTYARTIAEITASKNKN